jgi:glycosyltransferase involved in cell wall biosynthesis
MLPFLDRFALARLRRRAGLVLTVHNAEIATHSSSAIVGRLGAMLQAMGQTEAVSIFDRYVAHTIKTVKQLERLGIAPERILLMPHPPLDLDTAAPSTVPAPGKASWNFLFFGSIKPYKGVDILIEAGLRVASMRRDFRIIIAGRPFQALDGLRSRIDAAGANDLFHFDLDYLPSERLANYLTQASAVVFPYREIDGSGALALAARFHKPIIASRVGVFAEAPAKDLIRLVPAEDPKALAAALTALLNNPADLETLTDGSRRLESLLPSWPDFARTCHAAYREILEERRIG